MRSEPHHFGFALRVPRFAWVVVLVAVYFGSIFWRARLSQEEELLTGIWKLNAINFCVLTNDRRLQLVNFVGNEGTDFGHGLWAIRNGQLCFREFYLTNDHAWSGLVDVWTYLVDPGTEHDLLTISPDEIDINNSRWGRARGAEAAKVRRWMLKHCGIKLPD